MPENVLVGKKIIVEFKEFTNLSKYEQYKLLLLQFKQISK